MIYDRHEKWAPGKDMAKQFSVESGIVIASHLSLLAAEKLPSTEPFD